MKKKTILMTIIAITLLSYCNIVKAETYTPTSRAWYTANGTAYSCPDNFCLVSANVGSGITQQSYFYVSSNTSATAPLPSKSTAMLFTGIIYNANATNYTNGNLEFARDISINVRLKTNDTTNQCITTIENNIFNSICPIGTTQTNYNRLEIQLNRGGNNNEGGSYISWGISQFYTIVYGDDEFDYNRLEQAIRIQSDRIITSDETTRTQIINTLTNILNNINNNNTTISNKIDDIKNADAPTSETPDTTGYDDFNTSEKALTNEMKKADMSKVQIAIDQNSSNFVWTLMTNLLNTNALVIGLYISILSIGIIKLILGR